jgi:2'-5' RNA ligase
MNMAPMAVDVVLLPEEAMTQRAMALNRQLVAEGRPEIVLNQQDCLPHISLAMGCLADADLQAVGERLKDRARQTTVRELEVVALIRSVNSRGETTALLEVGRTGQLQALHEQIMADMTPWFTYAVTEAMVRDEIVAPSALDWIRTYPRQAAYENFRPHITLGYGRLPADPALPIRFCVTRLALCHLGNHCTCRRTLLIYDL